MIETMKEAADGALSLVLMLVLPAAWLTGLFEAAGSGDFLMFFVYLVLPPVGMFGGFVQWFS